MVSAEQKQQTERLRCRRIIGAGIGLSLLFHGALWGVMRQIPPPQFTPETTFEVTLSPQTKPKPKLQIQRAPQIAKAPSKRERRISLQPKHRRKRTLRRAIQEPQRRVRVAQLPDKRNFWPAEPNFSATAKAPQPTTENSQKSAFRLNPLQTPRTTPRSDNSRTSPGGFQGPRPDGRSSFTPAGPARSTLENELANLPQSDGSFGSTGNRSGRRRSGSTEVYPSNEAPNGTSSDSSSSGALTSATLSPRSISGTINDRTADSSFASGTRLSRDSQRGNRLPSKPPSKKLHPTDGSPRSEEANDSTAADNQPRRPRIARRPNRSDQPELFPTPTAVKPKGNPQPKQEERPEPELFRQARVRSAPKPAYPADAKANNQEGTVVVRLQISENGRVTEASLVSSSGVTSLDAASLQGVRRWTYEPARRGKNAVSTSLTARLRWRLTD